MKISGVVTTTKNNHQYSRGGKYALGTDSREIARVEVYRDGEGLAGTGGQRELSGNDF